MCISFSNFANQRLFLHPLEGHKQKSESGSVKEEEEEAAVDVKSEEQEDEGMQDSHDEDAMTEGGVKEENEGAADAGEGPLQTYAIITMAPSKQLEWLHDRMPAILTTPEEVRMKWIF